MYGFVVVDMFGMEWGDLVEDLETARQQLREIREDCKNRGYDDFEFEIERRKIS